MSLPPDRELAAFVEALALAPAGARQSWTPLTGGVSCQAWRVEAGDRTICVKRALEKLAVAADWRAPVGRCLFEYRWFKTARAIVAGAAPAPLGLDTSAGLIAMEWLDPADYPLWKGQLLAGVVETATAGAVGDRLGRIHAATAGRDEIARRFDNADHFFALRLEPYLLAAAERRPAVAAPLRELVRRTAAMRLALAHGDVSPKNILVGPGGPVFLDAETATFGDPAFDLAFCLNHLLLKCLVVPGAIDPLLSSFSALRQAYLARVDWEAPGALEARAASLLPGLLIARVDGKSPVEYLPDAARKAVVRATAEPLLIDPPDRLETVSRAWQAGLEAARPARKA